MQAFHKVLLFEMQYVTEFALGAQVFELGKA